MELLFRVIRGALWMTVAFPLVLWSAHIYPQVFVRTTFFQFLVEIALLAFFSLVFLCALKKKNVETFFPAGWWRSPLLATVVLLFGVSAFLSTLVSLDTKRAWFGVASWGNEGMLMYAHYLAFLFFLLAFFSQRDMLRYLFASIVVGLITASFAILQFIGIDPLSLTPDAGGRVGSFLENPTYLAAYLTVLLAFSGIILRHGGTYMFLPQRIRVYAPQVVLGFVVLALFVIGLTQTRGALVGVAAGTVVFLVLLILRAPSTYRLKGFSLRAIGIVMLAAFFLFGGIFWITRSSSLWDTVPVLSRVTNISATDPTVATRLISIEISWDAFRERPLLGWGLDNAYIAHTQHYRPELFQYEETWFERMHNKVADVAVAQGLVGVAALVLLWTLLGVAVWRDVRTSGGAANLIGSALIAGGLTAYLGQDMFAFDLPTSYIPFFVLLAFYVQRNAGEEGVAQGSTMSFRSIRIVGSPVAILIILYALVGFTIIPFRQSALLISSLKGGAETFRENEGLIYGTPSHIEADLQRVAILELQKANAQENSDFREPLQYVATKTAERVRGDEYDARSATLLSVFAIDIGNERQAEEFGLLGIQRAPLRPDSYHALGRALMNRHQYEQAQSILRQGIELNNSIASSHFYYGTALALEDSQNSTNKNQNEALSELKKARELGLVMSRSRYDTIGSAMFTYQQWEELASLMDEAINENPDVSRMHQLALAAAIELRDQEGALAQAKEMQRLNQNNPQLLGRIQSVMVYVQNEQWSSAASELGIR